MGENPPFVFFDLLNPQKGDPTQNSGIGNVVQLFFIFFTLDYADDFCNFSVVSSEPSWSSMSLGRTRFLGFQLLHTQ